MTEKKKETSSLKGQWPFSSFLSLSARLMSSLKAQPYLGRAVPCRGETAARQRWFGQQEFSKYFRHIPP